MNRVKHILKTLTVASVLLLFSTYHLAYAFVTDETSERILRNMQKMEEAYPQQKVFLHLDKEEYLAGETIWFKAYVVNATTHQPDHLSSNLHVQLITTTGDIASSLLLRLRNGVAHGDITLPDSIAGGNYEFIAYTDWMKNFDQKFFFNKDIYVINPIEENFIRFSDVIRNRRFNRRLSRKSDNMQFAFFPEGGNLLAGAENRIAFKAANELGAGMQASGRISDGRGNELLTFETLHNGMGYFSLTPEAGIKYTARVTFENGDTKTLRLPAAQPQGFLLSAKERDGVVEVRVESNHDAGTAALPEFYIMAQTRGRPYHIEKVSFTSNKYTTRIPVSELPTGVCQVMLFTATGQPIAERLIFINRGDMPVAEITDFRTQKSDDGDMISINLKSDNRSRGSYSLAVVDAADSETDYRSNILSELLLFSELGYRLKDPGFYLNPDNANASEALDLVMMTHGWKRFDFEDILDKEFPEIRYGFPEGITLRGTVKPRSSAKKTGEVPVELAVHQDEIDVFDTTTDGDGNFVFTNLYYDGLFTAKLAVSPRYDRRAMNIRLTETSLDEIQYSKNFQTRPLLVTSRGDDWERVPRPETVLRRRGLITPGDERTPSMYAQADQVIYFDDIRDQYSSIMDVLRTRVRGLRIINGQIMLRGPSSVVFTNEPLFLIDETVVDRGAFLNTSVRQVDRLAVMSGPQTAILGSRGTNGALLIYTMRGDSEWHMSHDYVIQGFHEPAETFEAKIYSEKYELHNTDRTLFWDPDFSADNNGEATLSFPAGQNYRNIRLILQGVDQNGRITFLDKILE